MQVLSKIYICEEHYDELSPDGDQSTSIERNNEEEHSASYCWTTDCPNSATRVIFFSVNVKREPGFSASIAGERLRNWPVY